MNLFSTIKLLIAKAAETSCNDAIVYASDMLTWTASNKQTIHVDVGDNALATGTTRLVLDGNHINFAVDELPGFFRNYSVDPNLSKCHKEVCAIMAACEDFPVAAAVPAAPVPTPTATVTTTAATPAAVARALAAATAAAKAAATVTTQPKVATTQPRKKSMKVDTLFTRLLTMSGHGVVVTENNDTNESVTLAFSGISLTKDDGVFTLVGAKGDVITDEKLIGDIIAAEWPGAIKTQPVKPDGLSSACHFVAKKVIEDKTAKEAVLGICKLLSAMLSPAKT